MRYDGIYRIAAAYRKKVGTTLLLHAAAMLQAAWVISQPWGAGRAGQAGLQVPLHALRQRAGPLDHRRCGVLCSCSAPQLALGLEQQQQQLLLHASARAEPAADKRHM